MQNASAPTPRVAPPRVGRYEVLLPIASGGMATVYLARVRGARGFEREVALKLTHLHLAEEIADFATVLVEEARIASRIKHRNVVSILDVGEDPHGLFLVMEYVEGDTLAGLQRAAAARGETLRADIGVRIVLDALAGLHAAHELRDERGEPMEVIHRDFSPQNILVGLDGVAQLGDFGVAKASDRRVHTATGVVKGKVPYMSPEHARSERIDRRADVWSAGVVVWEIFAGRRLYAIDDGVAMLLKLVSERPPRLGSVKADVPPELEEVVARALEPDVALRCPTAAALARDLSAAFTKTARVAEHDEVGELVRRLAGTKLEQRRSLVLGKTARPSIEPPDERSSSADPPAIEPASAEPASLDHTDPFASTRVAPVVGAEPAPRPEPAPPALDPPSHARPGRPLWSRWPIAGAVALGVGGAVLVYELTRGSDRATDVAPSTTDGSPAAPAASEARKDEPFAAQPTHVQVHASARVSALKVGARSFAVTPAVTDFDFDRFPEDGPGVVTVVATSADGRKRTLSLAPGAAALDVDFPVSPHPSLGTPIRPGGTPSATKSP